MRKKIELDGVLLTQQTFDAWSAVSQSVVETLRAAGTPIHPSEIGEEYAELDDQTGILTIKCQIGKLVASLEVSKGQWSWNN